MKNNLIEHLSDLNKIEQGSLSGSEIFPTSHQLRKYQQLSHKLRSIAFTGVLTSLAKYLVAQWLKISSYRQRRMAVAELDKLDSFMLKDIGMTRSDIESLRNGSTTIDQLNERRFNTIEDRIAINGKAGLSIYKCNQKIIQNVSVETTLAKCG